MSPSDQVCSQCDSRRKLTNLFGYYFCDRCQSKLGLHADKTILKNAQARSSNGSSYADEIVQRLEEMEKKFVQAKVKLLHIVERLDELT